jgi:heme O synthase-like polyprenyltransferase
MSFNVETIKNYMVLTGIGNSVFATFPVFLAGILSEDVAGHVIEYLLAASVAIFLFTGSFAINDYYDRFTDRLNGKMARPLETVIYRKKSPAFRPALSGHFPSVICTTWTCNSDFHRFEHSDIGTIQHAPKKDLSPEKYLHSLLFHGNHSVWFHYF